MNIEAVRQSIVDNLNEEIEVGPAGSDKFYFALPLEYPGGDSVVVYTRERGDGVEVSDFGGSWEVAMREPGVTPGRLREAASQIATELGVQMVDGSFVSLWQDGNLADVVWRVGLASGRLGDAPTFFATERKPRERDFVETVDAAVRAKAPVERSRELEGKSGHTYTATFFVPTQEAVLEPWTPLSGWNRAYAVYSQFGDLSRVNGYKTITLVDDRKGDPHQEVLSFLAQVSDVVNWTKRDKWLSQLGE
jgi:hypothetical protein